MLDLSAIKQPAVIVAAITTLAAGSGGLYQLIDSNAKAQAEIKVREKYDKVLTDYAVLAATCQSK